MRASRRRRPLVRAVAPPPAGVNLKQVAKLVKYVGSAEHKDSPSFAGDPRPRADAGICDPALADQQARVTRWLRQSIRAGDIGAYFEGAFPRYVWFRDRNIVYEGRLVNREAGWYKGYPLERDEWPIGMGTCMGEIDFSFEWIDPMAARGEEHRATWSRFELFVKGEPVTRVLDRTTRSVRTSVYMPLYPLAEWIATNWWFLFAELETPGRSTEASYSSRHNIRYGSAGFALPSLSIRPLGREMRLDWRPVRLEHHWVEFVGRGSGVFEAERVREFLTRLVVVVVERLEECGITDSLLQEEWREIVTTDAEEAAFCASAAALGMDPYALDDASQEAIVAAGELLPAELVEDFFAVAEFRSLGVQARRVMEAIGRSRANPSDLRSLKELRGELARHHYSAGTPWQQGYDFARELRSVLGLNGQVLRDLSEVGRAFSVEDRELAASILEAPPLDAPFDAVVDVNERGSPGFVIPARREEAVRFAFCRGLFEFLAAPPDQPALVTRTRSDRQKRNRAFAAEFLVPASALRARIPLEVVGEEQVDDLAAEFGVATHVIRHQLVNHELARVVPV